MRHLGDITKLDGATIEPVWCVTGGSPCQDLSIAGKRAGLAGARSGLFMEQIRVIKEMREHDKQLGRTGELIRPRYMVWENVPGALSSNKGRDFAAVLEETIRIAEPEAPGVEVPAKGWPTRGGYRDVGGRWSVAWRVHDAQYWGVPQRRRRIALVADFGGDTAYEILFERKGVSGDSEPRGEARERPAGDAEAGTYLAIPINDKATRYAGGGSTRHHDGSGNGLGIGKDGDPSPTITAGDRHAVAYPAIARSLTARADGSPCIDRGPNIVCSPHPGGCEGGGKGALIQTEKSGTLETGNDQTIFQAGAFKLGNSATARMIGYEVEVSPTLNAECGGNKPAVCYQMQGFGNYRQADVASACKQRDYKDSTDLVQCNMVVRRLTPLECERLQGYPDGWTNIGDYTDSTGKTRKTSDSARYKALGNSIALPFWRWMFGRMAAYLPEGATLGSLFDGIGGFPLCWEDVHGAGTARWASEIEEFPIAVTKKRFGGENMIHYALNIEPPVEPPAYTCPICPVCGAETDTVYKNVYGDPVGCPECVTEVDAWTA